TSVSTCVTNNERERSTMNWSEMIEKLKNSGVRDDNLPARGHDEGNLGLRQSNGKYRVSITERGTSDDIAEFSTEESAIDFIYDREVINFRLNGDTRFDKWNMDRKAFPLPRAEDFGGRTLTG